MFDARVSVDYSPNERAFDGRGEHSPFAQAFVAALDSAKTTPVTGTMLHSMVQRMVASQTYAQTPVLNHNMETSPGTSDFIFMRAAQAP